MDCQNCILTTLICPIFIGRWLPKFNYEISVKLGDEGGRGLQKGGYFLKWVIQFCGLSSDIVLNEMTALARKIYFGIWSHLAFLTKDPRLFDLCKVGQCFYRESVFGYECKICKDGSMHHCRKVVEILNEQK